ncbi:MazG nucleotide pyrophosphohydrolase domain-containing protein [Bdellovibrio sp. HCB337]|uniref:MazG nucleotide pyrophosphohydrolase domain-containing protein n=1 Tax=Bdellovibrio sp. HCB337 TaxID=3394358 RepID=UPI0039A4DEAD
MNDLIEKVEKISQGYALKMDIERTADWFMLKLQEELGELTQSYMKVKGQARASGKSQAELQKALADEAADVLCHTLLFAKHNGIDLETAIKEKWLKYL